MLAAYRKRCQRLSVPEAGHQRGTLSGRSYVGVVETEGLAEAWVVRCQTDIEFGVIRFGGLHPLVFQVRNSLAFLQQLFALAQQTTPLAGCCQRLFPFGGIGGRQIKGTAVVEAWKLKDKAPLLGGKFAKYTFHSDVRWLMVFSMYTYFAAKVAFIVIITPVKGSRFVVLQQIAVSVVLVARLSCISQQRDDALRLTRFTLPEQLTALWTGEVVVFDFLIHQISPTTKTLVSDSQIAVDGTKVNRCLFVRMVDAEDTWSGHSYPIVTPPSLYHQQ